MDFVGSNNWEYYAHVKKKQKKTTVKSIFIVKTFTTNRVWC
jgi:hypothetical protein